MQTEEGSRFSRYTFKLVREADFDPEDEIVDVRIYARDGREYSGNFVTTKFIKRMFEKNKRTGECAHGAYFCVPGMIVVERVDAGIVTDVIDDMIKNNDIETYFRPLG